MFMKIFRAIGLIIGIIGLKILMPKVFGAFEHTLLSFFDVVQGVFVLGGDTLHTMPAAVLFPQLPH